MYKFKGAFFNILIVVYAFLLQKPLATKMDFVMKEKQAWISMAFMLFILSLLEGIYLPLKINNSHYQTENEISPNDALIWFLTPLLFRTIIGLAMAATVYGFLVPDIRIKTFLSPVGVTMAIILVLKELVILFIGFIALMGSKPRHIQMWMEWTGDVVILAYTCIAYTIMTRPGFFFPKSSHSMEMLPLIIFCFFGFLLSLRLGFNVEEYLISKTLKDRIIIWGTLVLAAVTAAWAFNQ